MDIKIWNRKPPTREMLEDRRKQIEEQRALYELEIEIEKEAIAFQEYKLRWLDDRVTLDEILNDDTWSLCKKISKLRGERSASQNVAYTAGMLGPSGPHEKTNRHI